MTETREKACSRGDIFILNGKKMVIKTCMPDSKHKVWFVWYDPLGENLSWETPERYREFTELPYAVGKALRMRRWEAEA